MKPGFVLDCSLAMSWCFASEHNPPSEAALLYLRDVPAIVPLIWPLEVANVLLMCERKGRITTAEAMQFVNLIESLPISVDEGSSSARAWHRIMPIGREHGLTSYDASYIDLSLRLDLCLATLDEKMKKAARSAGVELLKLH